jgi:hypothetical protein
VDLSGRINDLAVLPGGGRYPFNMRVDEPLIRGGVAGEDKIKCWSLNKAVQQIF